MHAEHRSLDARPRRWGVASHALLALLAYVPMLRTAPGIVSADTKTYLYLDPAKLMARAVSMWDPNVGMGTLTHQTIGYLFPMGPWYWIFDRIGTPDWVAQRLWLGTVLFAAGAGVLYLTRILGWRGAAPLAAALVYMLTPYLLDYSARISVILLPWAALPWLIGLADRALRRGGWRHPAAFALVVLAVGGVNATALVFAGLGPVLWFPFAVANGEATWRRALATVARIGILTALVSLWWVIGLSVQGKYGIPILRYTETVETVARTSLASEVMRGLGYWFFYGNDKLGPWIDPAVSYTQHPWLLATSFAVPVIALAAAAFLRWRHRAYCITLIAVGAVIAIGAHPYDHPSPLGGVFKAFATSSTVGLALRSTPRAVPLIALGMALLLGAAITAILERATAVGLVAAALVGVLAIVNLPPLLTGDLAVGKGISRPEKLPSYWYDAAHYLDSRGDATRVLELPGSDFAAYRWGNTIDPVTPYLMERPYVARELIPYGTAGTADLLNALDRRLQEGVFEPSSLAPLARLMGVGDVVLRNDLQYERYRTPRPRALWQQFTPPPPGLDAPVGFGPGKPNRSVASLPLLDEIALGTPASVPDPPEVAAFGVQHPVPIVRTAPDRSPVVVAGDGEGLVDLAASGLLDPTRLTRYAATLDADPGAWAEVAASDATLVLTDTNRLRARRWGTVRENNGYTEQPGAGPLVTDPADARLDLFPNESTGAQTIAQLRGVASVRATHYGNPVSYTAEDRPANALDGDVSTAWRVGAFAPVAGEKLRIDLAHPVTAGSVHLVQPLTGARNRWITRLRLRFDDGSTTDVALDDSSRTPDGQTVTFPSRRFSRLELEILADNVGRRARYDGLSGVGLAEVGVADVNVDEVLRLPTDLLSATGARSLDHPLDVVMTRQRANPAEPVRADEEPTIKRTFSLPTARTFTAGGTLRIAGDAPDELIDDLVGAPGLAQGAPVARSDGRLNGDLRARASAAIDGDPTTAWMPGFLDQAGHWLEAESPAALTVDHLDLVLVADGRHSVPSRVRLDVDGRPAGSFDIPDPVDQATPGATTTVPLHFAPVRGRTFRLTIEAVHPRTTLDYYSGGPVQLPVGIAELGIPGLHAGAPAGASPQCRTVATVDGAPLRARAVASVDELLDE
ncbi:MAG TPA: alpha-(1-_3)-arabinofuranosyltransferase family protein, partial [Acidimicrobiales bacterium]|nr:alpha-(1->3)-arabinofuranosyltransferase family protein [Acidimicrobiales bacterium]